MDFKQLNISYFHDNKSYTQQIHAQCFFLQSIICRAQDRRAIIRAVRLKRAGSD